jgi:ABC-type polysaccharide/polyol phosphate export permease
MARSEPLDRLRLGWTAVALDALAAVASYVSAYRFRFEGADFTYFLSLAARGLPIMVSLHVASLALLRLYVVRGQRLWPVKLIAGTVLAAVAGFGVAAASVGPQGLSRQATLAYVLMLIVTGLAWRAAVGLYTRWSALSQPPADSHELEERGKHLRSMSGGVLLAARYRHLLRNLVAKDLKLKYRGSVLGVVWSLVHPLVMIVVYTFAFTYVLRVPTERYALFVLIGVLAWTFFAGAIIGSTAAIADGGSLIKSVVFPRIILPVSGVAFNLVQFLLSLSVLLPVLILVYRVPPSPKMLLFPVFLFLQVLFIVGLALLLSTATAFLRDVRHLAEVGISVAFWATPILYEHTLVPEQFRFALLLSPMASFVRAYQDIFYYQAWPDVSIWLVATAYAAGAFVCGLSVFVAYEDRFAEQV